MNTWTTTVQEDPDDPEGCIIVFPDDMMVKLGWAEGDTLLWTDAKDGSVILSRKE